MLPAILCRQLNNNFEQCNKSIAIDKLLKRAENTWKNQEPTTPLAPSYKDSHTWQLREMPRLEGKKGNTHSTDEVNGAWKGEGYKDTMPKMLAIVEITVL